MMSTVETCGGRGRKSLKVPKGRQRKGNERWGKERRGAERRGGKGKRGV